jgi:hypothetical protein
VVIYRGTKFSRGSLWSRNRGERSHSQAVLESRKVGTGEGEAESAARFIAIRVRREFATIPEEAG